LKIDFKTLSMMALRSSPGDVLDRVSRDGEVFVIERNGQPRACLVPVSFLLPDVSPERVTHELNLLNEKKEAYKLTITDNKELEISCHETAAGDNILISVVLPHGYPNSAPRIYAIGIPSNAPKRWHDGSFNFWSNCDLECEKPRHHLCPDDGTRMAEGLCQMAQNWFMAKWRTR